MKIAILEATNFSDEQIAKLEKVGEVDYYDNPTDEQLCVIAPQYDVVVVNWIDPSPFILKMKTNSLIALLSTGYGWIQHMKEAKEKEIYVSNIPNYCTEAVSQHLLGLLLGVSKKIFPALTALQYGVPGFELQGKTIGVIGLGHIGSRFSEIMQFFGANVITYNRHKKNSPLAKDVTLEELLSSSDVICVTCANNEDSKNMINVNNYGLIKRGAILIGSTWGIIEDKAVVEAVKDGTISSVAFDAALEANSEVAPDMSRLVMEKQQVFLTPHIAYNTFESEKRQLDICVNNIISFANGSPINVVN